MNFVFPSFRLYEFYTLVGHSLGRVHSIARRTPRRSSWQLDCGEDGRPGRRLVGLAAVKRTTGESEWYGIKLLNEPYSRGSSSCVVFCVCLVTCKVKVKQHIQIAHFAAWNSPKREPNKRGHPFKLDDCRVWMRLMFWSARDTGLDRHTAFFSWLVVGSDSAYLQYQICGSGENLLEHFATELHL